MLKAVSQNLMHENLTITDGVYGVLSEKDVMGQIVKLGQKMIRTDKQDLSDVISLVKQLEQLLLQQSLMNK